MEKEYTQAFEYIAAQTKKRPKVALILGSGLGGFADMFQEKQVIRYQDIPGFSGTSVSGHAGELALCSDRGVEVAIMNGRFHYYEGISPDKIAIPVRALKLLGVDTLIVTNAAGGINEKFCRGDLMLITDHINLCGKNPLIGRNLDSFGLRFPDMSQAYSKELLEIAKKVAKKIDLPLKEGVYMYFSGPSFETPAEIRAARILGADAAGMSTVPEVIVANHCGINVLGISCITNMAAGVLQQPLTHIEVMETTEKVKEKFIELVKGIVEEMTKA